MVAGGATAPPMAGHRGVSVVTSGSPLESEHGVQSLPPPVAGPSWHEEYGFAPWVEPAYRRLASWGLQATAPVVLLGLAVAAYVAEFGRLTWSQQSNFGTMDYDLGIFDQEVWLAAHHLNPFLSIRGLNMWANHVNPIIYLLVPFYWLGAGPHFLLFVQTLALAGSAIPLWLLAKDRFRSAWLALLVAVAWLVYPAVEWMNADQFHPEMLGVAAFIFAYWFADRERWIAYGVAVALVLACKEDAALPILALGLVLVVRRRHWRAGSITIAAAVGWFLICTELIIPTAMGGAAPFFLYQYGNLGSSPADMVINVFRHPSRLWHAAVNHGTYRYLEQLFVPVAGLLLLAPVTLLLIIPTLLENVTNNQGYPHDIRYQYSAFVAAGVFIALIEGLARFRRQWVKAVLLGAMTLCVLLSNRAWSPSPLDTSVYRGGYWQESPSPLARTLNQMVPLIPGNVVVAATYSEVPHLTHRDIVYTFPNPWWRSYYGVTDTSPVEPNPNSVQYIVFDESELDGLGKVVVSGLTKPGGQFQILMERNGAILAKRVHPGGNEPDHQGKPSTRPPARDKG
jgi:uncharacterized membrane protein